jgi:uncharacterized protein
MMLPVGGLLPETDWPVAKPFWDFANKGQLRFPECVDCGAYQWYPRAVCSKCMSAKFRWDQVEPVGLIYSYTVVHRSLFIGTEKAVPFAVLQVQFPTAPGVTLITNLADDDQRPGLAIGVPVSIEFRSVASGLSMPYTVLR